MSGKGLGALDRAYYDSCPDGHFDDSRSFEILDFYRWEIACRLLTKVDPIFPEKTGFKILDFGAGSGKASFLYSSKASECYLVDHSFRQLAGARDNLSNLQCSKFFIVADAHALPFKSRGFDFCFVREVLHHLENPNLSIKQLIDVGKKYIVIDEPHAGGRFRRLLFELFVLLRIQERYEHDYLDPYRFSLGDLRRTFEKEDVNYLVYPYFIYYFDRLKGRFFLQRLYTWFLRVLNLFLNSQGNRIIIIVFPPG